MFLEAIERRNAHVQQIMDAGKGGDLTNVVRISDTCADCRQAVRGDVHALLGLVKQALDPKVMARLLLKAQYGEARVGADEREACAELAKQLTELLHAELHVERHPLPVRSHS